MKFVILLACFVAAQGNGVYKEEHHAPQPYAFGYKIKDKEGEQHREESGDGAGHVKGSYGFIDNKGKRREVAYVADHGGFRAAIKTNEPGTSNQSPAAVQLESNDPYAQGGAVPYNSRPNDPYVAGLAIADGKYGFPTVYHFNPNAIGYANPIYGYGYNNMMGGYGQQGGVVYYGANLVGGVIRGMDSRFANRPGQN